MESFTSSLKFVARAWKKLILAFCLLIQPLTPAWAADAEQDHVQIQTQLPDISEKGPGQNFIIDFQILDSRDPIPGTRALVNLDGQLMEVPVHGGRMNKKEEIEYYLDLPAPIQQLSFRILIPTDANGYLASKRFVIRRNCVPNTNLIDLNAEWRVPGSGIVRALIERSNTLQSENDAYDQVDALLKELKSVIEGSGQ